MKIMKMVEVLKLSNFTFFLDSGAHSLYTKNVNKSKTNKSFAFYESDIFWNYVDDYIAFVKKNKEYLDVYVNVDVIFNPKLTWKVQKYLEAKGLSPLPVFHPGEDIRWLKKYMDSYDYIGIGGLGQEWHKTQYHDFADRAFCLLCDEKGFPKWKTHGFAMTSFDLIYRYPWYSVDSTTWIMKAAMGSFIMPQFRNGIWDYSIPPIDIRCSVRKCTNLHYSHLSGKRKQIVDSYLARYSMKMGQSVYNEVTKEETVIEKGVCNDYNQRLFLNIIYFKELEKTRTYPQPFYYKQKGELF